MPRPKKSAEDKKAAAPIAAVPAPMIPTPMPIIAPPLPQTAAVVPQRVVDNDSFLRVRDSVCILISPFLSLNLQRLVRSTHAVPPASLHISTSRRMRLSPGSSLSTTYVMRERVRAGNMRVAYKRQGLIAQHPRYTELGRLALAQLQSSRTKRR